MRPALPGVGKREFCKATTMTVLLSLLTLLALDRTRPGKPAAFQQPRLPTPLAMEMRGGQRFVKHRVGRGETLTGPHPPLRRDAGPAQCRQPAD
ncbi:MAG: hypothetical protein WKG07_28975 [Hymenobacter sp.]